MNREIKFKVRLNELSANPGLEIIIVPWEFKAWDKVDLLTLRQFTGLHDKNKKNIYEGDICKIPVWFGETYTLCPLPIIFKNGMFCYELYCGSGDYLCMSLEYSKDMEIIGNIHKNPELLGDSNG